MEIIIHKTNIGKPKFAVFDFDGTLSTLRHGWENIMEPMMLEMICGQEPVRIDILREVKEYIDASTGIQTIYQMQWLSRTVKKYGINTGLPEDPWWYKEQYNQRLMELVEKRKKALSSGEKSSEDFMIMGSRIFLKALKDLGVLIYVASGTDHPDVVHEAACLGLQGYFKEIAGAPLGRMDCSKEAVLKSIFTENSLQGSEVVVIGDGKVEIALGREFGATTLGVASDEVKCRGINSYKAKRLIKAGAHAITGDYEKLDDIIFWLGFN